jgi:lipid A 3-O-deacylase
MRHFLHITILLIVLQILTGNKGWAQSSTNATLTANLANTKSTANGANTDQGPTRLFRVFWDDDYINYSGHGTDRAYTAGTRLELFYTKNKPSHFFIDRIMPKAGDSSINIFGWGLSQLMITPDAINQADMQPDDYPWSGELFATHTLYSYNEQKKYDLQTEIDLGVRGPAALAGEAQDLVHQMIRYQRPKGWDNQFGNTPVLDVSFTAEKQLAGYHGFIEAIGGGQVIAGTAMNAAAAYSLIRIGKMNPYFKGFMKQYSGAGSKKKVQFYFVFKPQVEWQVTNALFEGGMFTPEPTKVVKKPSTGSETYHPLNPVLYSFAFGPVLVINHFTISSTQTSTSRYMKGLYDHTYGNISLYYSW